MSQNSYLSVRKDLYDEIYRSLLSDLDINYYIWRDYPYSKLKSYYYIEVGAIFAYFLLKTKISPNSITLFYASLGIIGMMLFSFNSIVTTTCALFVFFSKSIPDWIDGYIARQKKQTSSIGYFMDEWGALVNLLGFQLGVSVYVAYNTDEKYYFILGMMIVLLYAIDFRKYLYLNSSFEYKALGAKENLNAISKKSSNKFNLLLKTYKILRYDGRSKYTDTVILVILVELFMGKVYISNFIVLMWFFISVSAFIFFLKTALTDENF